MRILGQEPLLDDREELANRVLAAFDAVSKIETIDTNKIAIMGYCFGGLVAIDLARTGADI